MSKKWRVGIIGIGGICKGSHLPEYLSDERLEVAALCDIIIERAEEIRDKYFPDAAVYSDYKELLKDGSIDSIDICTPNYLHSIIAVDAFEAGKHVFCEKPDAVTASKYAKKYIESGRMGEIYCGRCGWQRRRGIPGKGGWFTTKEQSGGGPLIDLGVHMIDLAIWLMGNPTPVAVSGNTYMKFADNDVSDSVNSDFGDKNSEGTFDVEDLAMGMIRFDNGALLQIEFSWASNIEKENRFVELRGTRAGLSWSDGGVKIFSEENGELTDTVSPTVNQENGHRNNLKHFYDVVIDGAEPQFKPQQGIDMIKILCAIYESARTGKEVIL